MRDQFCCSLLPYKKQGSDSCLILQTTPDILARHVQTVCLGCRMSYSVCLTNFSHQLSVEVSLAVTGRLEDSGRQNDEKMTRKTGNAQSRSTFFRHSAVLLCKVSNAFKENNRIISYGCIKAKLSTYRK